MEQEKVIKNLSEVQEAELKEEKTKKIFIIFVVLLLFGGTCYYYSGVNNPSKTEKISKIEQIKAIFKDKKTPAQKPVESKIVQKTEAHAEIAEEITPKKVLKTKLKPADKSAFLSLKEKSSGKNDPFSYSESHFAPAGSGQGENSTSFSGSFPPVPNSGNTGTLPSLSGLPGIPSAGLAPPPAPKPEDLVVVKGFIGNKVIVEIDGVVEALKATEQVSDIKVLAVNPSALTAKFKINGKTVTKTIRSLTEDYNGELQLVKNLHY